MQNNVPEDLVQQVEAAIANGTPLPPGVQIVPPGMPVPPGATELQVKAPKKQAMLPLAPNENLVPELRKRTNCAVVPESATLDSVLKQLMAKPLADIEVTKTRMTILADGISAALLVPAFCAQQLKNRPICSLKDNEDIAKITSELAQLETEGTALNNALVIIIEKAEKLASQRWDLLVKHYGLDPVRNSYKLDETDGTLTEVTLQCADCKGLTRIRKSRQAIQENLSHTEIVSVVTPENKKS